MGFDLLRGLAYDPSTDTLYGTDPDTDELAKVDRDTGQGTAIASLGGVLDPVPPVAVDCSTPGAVHGSVGAAVYNGQWFHRTWDTNKGGSNTILVSDRGDGLGEVILRMTMRNKDNDTQHQEYNAGLR